MNNKSLHSLSLGACAWLCTALFTSCQTPAPKSSAELLQGYWENQDCSVNISGNSLYFYEREDFWYLTEFEFAGEDAPNELRATIVEDSNDGPQHIGGVVDASFAIEGEVLTLIALQDGKPPEDGSGRYVLERSEPREGRIRPVASE